MRHILAPAFIFSGSKLELGDAFELQDSLHNHSIIQISLRCSENKFLLEMDWNPELRPLCSK